MSMLFAYMAGGEGAGGLAVLKCFVRGVEVAEFFLLVLCVRGGEGWQVQYLSFREKNDRPPPINK